MPYLQSMSTSIYGLNDNVMVKAFGRTHPDFVHVDEEDPRDMNLASANFAALARVLELPVDEGGMGSLPVADLRRRIIRANASLEARVQANVRPESVEYGAPRQNPDGTVELRPLRMYGGGLDADRLGGYVVRLEELVLELERRGATRITWV